MPEHGADPISYDAQNAITDPEAFSSTRPITDMSLRGGDGITHLHYTGTPLWKFGHGLSYTNFDVTIEAEPEPLVGSIVGDGGAVGSNWTVETFAAATRGSYSPLHRVTNSAPAYSIRVTNTGAVGGGFNAMAFVTMSRSDQGRFGFPIQRLFAFAGIDWLDPGVSQVLELAIPTAQQLSVADEHGQQWLHAGEYMIHIGGPPLSPSDDASAAKAVVSKLLITGEAPLPVSPPLATL